MDRPRLLDLFCGGGGAGVGYARAGWDVFGVDVAERSSYPFDRAVGDALEYAELHGFRFDAIHASPPCQLWSAGRAAGAARHQVTIEHPDLIAPTRQLLAAIGRPFVIENVERAPLVDPVRLCGSGFGLGTARHYLRRHRLFELGNVDSRWPLLLVPPCAHPADRPAISVFGKHGGGGTRRDRGSTAEWRQAMGIDWMPSADLSQAIPPAYTELVGRWLLEGLR
jgi:DNA (cytosine-5)-methyltransferase 1